MLYMFKLTRREEQVLLAVWQLKDSAYLVSVRKYLTDATKKTWSIGSVHKPLTILEERGYLSSYEGTATAIRGGRRKKLYKLTNTGLAALTYYKKVAETLWLNFEGVEFQK